MSMRAYEEREKRGDYRAGVVWAAIINTNRDPKKSRRAQPKDPFPSLEPPKRAQTPEEQRHVLLAMAALTGGKVVRMPREEFEAMTRG
jgi:hypothetical protein